MEVMICVPTGTDISVIEIEYPDIYEDEEYEDHQRYFVGKSMEEENSSDFLTYNEAVACCGFVEGAIKGAETLIEGNGGWAQGMLSRKGFEGMAVSPQQKSAWTRRSNLWWKHHKRGELARVKHARLRPAQSVSGAKK